MASLDEEPLYCSCRMPYDDTLFMIQCDICNEWYHGKCVGIREYQAGDVDEFHCPECQKVHGPSTLKQKRNSHRHDSFENDSNPVARAVQSGSVSFIDQLKQRKFASAQSVTLKMKGYQVTVEHLEMSGFNAPILVEDSAGLDLIVPPPSFTIRDVERYVGSEMVVDVIDVAIQSELKMSMHEWVEYFCGEPRSKVLNLISLEFSDTGLSQLVSPPRVVLELSWVSNYWPAQSVDDPHGKPEVQKYCLMSAKDSYTDFHIDFGGTSVWYHVLWGEKVFYLIKPSASALAAYEDWSSSPDHSEVFFGDRVEHCYQLVLTRGQTLFIPTGWIHAVYTPVDSLVFGGNFLHSLNVGLQLRMYDLEQRLQLPHRFLFPNFETTCWYAARHIADTLKEHLEESKKPPPYLCRSAKELLAKLRSWTQPKDPTVAWVHKNAIPDGIQPRKVLRDLTDALGVLAQSNGSKQLGALPKKKQPKAAAGVAAAAASPAAGSGGGKRDKLTVDLDVLEQHTHQALKESEESVTLKVKVPKRASDQAHRGVGLDESDNEGLTIDDGASSQDESKPSALKLKLHLAEKQAGVAAGAEWDKKKTAAEPGSGVRPDAAALGANLPPPSRNTCRSGEEAAATDRTGPAAQQSHGKAGSEQQQLRREAGSSRRQAVAEAAAAGRAYTRDDYVYPSLADSDGEDGGGGRAFTKVKSRSGRKRPNQDDAWYPSTKVKAVGNSGAEPLQASQPAAGRPVRSSASSATQNRGRSRVRWPGAGSEDESGGGNSSSQRSSDGEESDEQAMGGDASAVSASSAASGRFTGKMVVHELSSSRYSQPTHSVRVLMSATSSSPARKLKKGMSTTKQRLSKKLKLGQLA